jgi:thiol-disulfide isomerase/thioredoxin
MEEKNQVEKRGLFCGTSPKLTFLFGLITGFAILALIIFIFLGIVLVKGGQLTSLKGNSPKQTKETVANQGSEQETAQQWPVVVSTVGTFYEVNHTPCKDGKKPIVYMFSTSWCPHCQWSRPAFEAAVKDYVAKGKIVAYNWELDTNDNTLTTQKEKEVPIRDMQIYEEFNPDGSIPTFVFGCKYFRIGTGHERENDLAAEEKEFKDLIEKLLSS